MASDTTDDSGSDSENNEIIPIKAIRHSNNNYKRGITHASAKNNKLRHEHQGDYNTFIVPEILCQCQQKCTERVTPSLIQKVCMYFFGMRGSKEKQKIYLAGLILGKEKIPENIAKGKRIRKMSYRYFVPILTDKDLKKQTEENNINHKVDQSQTEAADRLDSSNEEWDHIEVCLKAFTSVHIISEKRVIVTRNVCKLKSSIRCSKPFPSHIPLFHNSRTSQAVSRPMSNGTKVSPAVQVPSTSDISEATATWLMNTSQKQQQTPLPFAVNPKTFLPEGLILPDSIICVPIFSETNETYKPITTDPNRDIDIVENFFTNQLWKPEFISNYGKFKPNNYNK